MPNFVYPLLYLNYDKSFTSLIAHLTHKFLDFTSFNNSIFILADTGSNVDLAGMEFLDDVLNIVDVDASS